MCYIDVYIIYCTYLAVAEARAEILDFDVIAGGDHFLFFWSPFLTL
jgi:hypothetical protein